MTAITDVTEIARIAYGFIASKTLFAALNLKPFDLLAEKPRSLAELAEETGRAEILLGALVCACVSLGLIEFHGFAFSNAPAARRYLVSSAPACFGDYYRFQIDRQVYPDIANLDRALAGDEAAGTS